MATFERIDPNGDLNTGKSVFFISDSVGGHVELSQEEAGQAMRWLRSFLEPLPSLHEQQERERAIIAQLATLPIPITIVPEHDKRGKQFYSWTAGTPGTPNPWGISIGATTEFHDAVSNALEQALKYALRTKSEE